MSEGARITCTDVARTVSRPGPSGFYIVRISSNNADRLGVRSGDYLRLSYCGATTIGRLEIDARLEDQTVRLDQTLRMALDLEAWLPKAENQRRCYVPEEPVTISRSSFSGPGWLDKLLGYQYIVCRVRIADPTAMEKPICQLSADSLAVIGVGRGGTVCLATETTTVKNRCLLLRDEDGDGVAVSDQGKHILLPWCGIDDQTRALLGVKLNQTVLVSRSIKPVLAAESITLSFTIAVAGLGVAQTLADAPNKFVIAGALAFVALAAGVGLIFKLRSQLLVWGRTAKRRHDTVESNISDTPS